MVGTDHTTLVAEDSQSTHQFAQGVCGGRRERVVPTVRDMLHGERMERGDQSNPKFQSTCT